jgi:hypothetical protein
MKMLIALAVIALSGCATGSRFMMQPDQSYLIVATRTTIYTPGMSDEAHRKAELLCPGGYTTDSEFQQAEKEQVLIVHCRPRLPAPA